MVRLQLQRIFQRALNSFGGSVEASMGVSIHPTAIVHPAAELGKRVSIGPYTIVGEKVKLGDDVSVASHVVIDGFTSIGARTQIWPFASIGTQPQDLKFKGEDTELVCGEDNMIREYVNMSLGTEGGGGQTIVGNHNLFMVNTHIAHDCIIGDHCIFANGVSLGGHIEVSDRAVFGGHSAVHQFVKIGSMAMLAGGSIVVQDVAPYCTVFGNHAKPQGLNTLGLRRAGLSRDLISQLKDMYRILYSSQLTFDDARQRIADSVPSSKYKDIFLDFLAKSKRGVCR